MPSFLLLCGSLSAKDMMNVSELLWLGENLNLKTVTSKLNFEKAQWYDDT